MPKSRRGQSGLQISELYRETGRFADDMCVINGMYTDIPNHEPSMFMMNSGHVQAVRPSYGSWLLYGLGTENQNLPGYVVLCPEKTVRDQSFGFLQLFLPLIDRRLRIHVADVKIRRREFGGTSRSRSMSYSSAATSSQCMCH